MLSLFTRRVALSAYRPTATYARILPSPASSLRAGTIAGLHIHTAQIPTNPQRNASTKATAVKETKASTTKKAKPSTKTTAAVKKTKSPTKSTTTGRANPRRNLTPEQKAAQKQKLQDKKEKATALRAKLKAQAEKQREAAAQKRKRLALAEKKKKLVEAKRAKEEKEKERKRIREAKKPKSAYIKVSCETLFSAASIVCVSHQTPSEAHEPILDVPTGDKETPHRGCRRLAQSL